ncbi:exonuclease 3'-5' domain-containing protein 2-like [Anneissia japonica]|uniref:exonuclease 3'-5' domain-containing protein 2-like n=1 Tax=Anneissia japonica TaxID=1529436 RepID=UPI00142573BC|nr:exonuclease 3'-5' domain-containing protein 2-like [Anneissia japonica]
MTTFEVKRLLLTSAATLVMVVWTYFWFRKSEDEGSEDDVREPKELKPISKYRNDSRTIVVISTKEDFKDVLPKLINDLHAFKVLGLDCEWCTKVKEVKPVALLQIATNTGLCILIRMNHFKSQAQLPTELLDILADKSIYKVGVGIMGDVKRLMKDYAIALCGIVDLRHLAIRHRSIQLCIQGGSLKELSEVVLGVEMNKSFDLKCSDWEADLLKPEQILYAANDALVAVDIFQNIVMIKMAKDLPSFSTSEKWNHVVVQCKGLVDCDFKDKFRSKRKKVDVKGSPTKPVKISSKPPSRMFRTRKEPLYHNCRLEAPDGRQLCICDFKKAEWYVRKGIGTVVSEDEPYTVRLNFEPAAIPSSDQEYYLQDKENICVVCGRGDMYMRKYVVPHEYRRYFPKKMRHHSSHDVLLLCIDCHLESWNHDQFLRRQLANECNADFDRNNSEYIEDHTVLKVRSAAKALLRNRCTIPEPRIKILESTVKNYYNVDTVDDTLLEKTVNLETRILNEEFTGSHGKKVVMHKARQKDGLLEFERMWRRHFVNTMKPQFLPALWSIDYQHPALDDSS